MVASVRRDSRIASTAARRSPRTSVRSAGLDRHVGAGAHRQPEVGLRERGGVVDAVADHRDHAALGLQPAHDRDLVLREHVGDDVHLVDADLASDRRARRPRCRRSAAPAAGRAQRSSATARRRRRLDGVGHDEQARAPARPSRRPPRCGPRSRRPPRPRRASAAGAVPTRRAAGAARRAPRATSGIRPRAGHDALDAEAVEVREPLDGGQVADLGDGAAATARAIGCSDACSSAPASRSTSARSTPSATTTSTSAIRAGRHRAGLVEHDGVDASGRLQHLGSPDQHAELGAPAGADHAARSGVASPRAHGQAMMRTATAAVKATSGSGTAAEPEAEGRSREHDARRARRRRRPGRRAAAPAPCRSARPRRAAPSGRAGCRLPTRVARTTSRPPALTVAPTTASPGPTSTGTGSPVSIDASTADVPVDDHAVGRDLLARPDDELVADGELLRPARGPRRRRAAPRRPSRPASSSARSAAPELRFARASS